MMLTELDCRFATHCDLKIMLHPNSVYRYISNFQTKSSFSCTFDSIFWHGQHHERIIPCKDTRFKVTPKFCLMPIEDTHKTDFETLIWTTWEKLSEAELKSVKLPLSMIQLSTLLLHASPVRRIKTRENNTNEKNLAWILSIYICSTTKKRRKIA